MTKWVIAVAATSCAYVVLELTWLRLTTAAFYRPALAPLLADKFKLPAVAVLYAIYIAGVEILAVRPALQGHSAVGAAVLGAVLGAVAYGTYDLTNLATLRGWPVKVTVVDLAWGALVTSMASLAGYWAATLVMTAA